MDPELFGSLVPTPALASGVRTGDVGQARVAFPAPTPVASQRFLMRARRISTGLFVYWAVEGIPDTTGEHSGHAGDVTDVVILGTASEE